ncbi:MAG: MFS transporter [Candidatus Pacearchaeota archaeon]
MKKKAKGGVSREKDPYENSNNIKLLGGSSFFNDIGSDMISPILPFYITALGGGGIAIGLLSGLREGLSSLLKILGGWISDLEGKRKKFVFLGYSISVVFRFLLLIASTWQQVTAFVSLERFGKARDAPRDAIISDSTKKSGHGFGLQQMMDTSGAVVGTLIVLFLFWRFEPDFKSIILLASIIGTFSLIPILFVKEPKVKKMRKNLLKGIGSLDKDLKYFILVSSVFTLSNFGLYMFLLLRAQELSGNFIVPLAMYALFSLFYAGFSIPFGNLSDKFGKKNVLFAGYSLFFFLTLGFVHVSNLFVFAGLFGLYGMVYAITKPGQIAFVSDLTKDMKGTAFGFYYFATGLITIPAGLIAGVFWNVDPAAMFYYLAVVAFISIILLAFAKEKK